MNRMNHMNQASTRPETNVLVVHGDLDLMEVLNHILENRGHTVYSARSGGAALAFLRSGCRFDTIIADWEPGRGVGQSLYDWAADNRPSLCKAFIALASSDSFVRFDSERGVCTIVHSFDLAEILRGVESICERNQAEAMTSEDAAFEGSGAVTASDSRVLDVSVALSAAPKADDDPRPSVLLVEDEPLQCDIMTEALGRLGFAVTAINSQEAALRDLRCSDYDVILSDWYLKENSAADLYAWLVTHKPHLAERCIFMSARSLQDGQTDEISKIGPSRPFVSKSGGTNALLGYLTGIAGRSRSRRIGGLLLSR